MINLKNTRTILLTITITTIAAFLLLAPTMTAQDAGYGYDEGVTGGGGGGAVVSKEVDIGNVSAGESKEVTVGTSTLSTIKISATNSVENASVTVTQTNTNPQDGSDPEGYTFGYHEIEQENLTDADVDEVTFNFRVTNTWISTMGIETDSIELQKYNPSNQTWESLSTTKVDEDSEHTYFEATSFGLSTFAIVGQAEPSEGAERQLPINTIFWGIIIAIVTITAILYVVMR